MSGTYNRAHLLFMKNKVNRYEHRSVGLCILLLCLSAGAMSGCSTLPPLENRALSTVVFDTGTTRLGKAITPLVEAHPGKSGLYPLPDARDAFAARSLLARAVERTLDLQYYIWPGDMSGTLLFEEVRRAANRGVRVRLLSSLHAKTFSVDRERVFIGSFHFDPRSAELNTELGFVIHSLALAKEIRLRRFPTMVTSRPRRFLLLLELAQVPLFAARSRLR